MRYRLGVDIGGTFTDIALLGADGSLHTKKVLSTPQDYSLAIESGVVALLAEAAVVPDAVKEFVHGSTVAANAIIERRGVKVALVTTLGFQDVLELGRFRSPRLYDLSFRKPPPLVERRLRFEITERILADGTVQEPVSFSDLASVADAIAREGVASIAVCFINAHVNAAHERAAVEFLANRLPRVVVCSSSEFMPQIQEYERTSTTVVNAYVRPVVERYLTALGERMRRIGIRPPIMVMQSSGGIVPSDLASTHPALIIDSGPAAGVVGAQRLGAYFAWGDLLVLDMGGTTAKATIIEDGAFAISNETELGGHASMGQRLMQGDGYVVQVPTIDIAEVGAGGGSLAVADQAGGLRVGPRSAGASPGPVCYARGGTTPTVTDANLILGYLNPSALVDGELTLDSRTASESISRLATSIGMSPIEMAYGIHAIADSTMIQALKAVTSERGRDPAQYTLVAIGGNGPVHAAGLADALRIDRIVVPPVAGVFSALGMLFADVEHQAVAAFHRRLEDATLEELCTAHQPLLNHARELLEEEGYTLQEQQDFRLFVDARYVGQTATLKIPIPLPVNGVRAATIAERFHEAHLATFGYRSGEPIQLTAIKLQARGVAAHPRVPSAIATSRSPRSDRGTRAAYFGSEHGWLDVPVTRRPGIAQDPAPGPLIIEEYETTIVVPPGWTVRRDAWTNLVIERPQPTLGERP